MAERATKSSLTEFTIVTSIARSLPPGPQWGTRISAGLESEVGKRALSSLSGARLADTAEWKYASRSRLCHAILSPELPHKMA